MRKNKASLQKFTKILLYFLAHLELKPFSINAFAILASCFTHWLFSLVEIDL